ncbi:type VII secretion target [Streptomyces yerevanensis]|uniref:type VII secretion target n=1 Tax=Streptomyces yerevanensis TaxID=66378 RepID=UPI000524FD40|nr:type VII secretion target [Streptomyces yerevanensis]
MSDQTADLTRIKASAKSLSRIHWEFTKNANPAEGLGSRTLGDQSLVDTFDDFGDNWKIHRERLTDELKKLSEVLSAAAKAYEDVDHQLAEALRGTDKKKPGAKGEAK